EGSIAFRRGAFSREENEVAVLQDRAAASTAAAAAAPAARGARNRRAGILVRRVLLAVPDLARLRPGLDQPRAHVTRRAIVLAEDRQALVGELQAAEAPLGLGEFMRLAGERRVERHHLVAEGDLVLEIAAVERLDPDERRRLIGAPVIAARARFDAGERR